MTLRALAFVVTLACGLCVMRFIRRRGCSRPNTVILAMFVSAIMITVATILIGRVHTQRSLAFDAGSIRDIDAQTSWWLSLYSGVNLGALSLATIAFLTAIIWRFRWGWLGMAICVAIWIFIAPSLLWHSLPRMF